MIFYKRKLKYKYFLLMLGVLFGLKLNAVTLQDAEKWTALARFPAVVGANVLEQQKGVAPKLARVIVDLVRLSNEILSIANNSKTINGTIHYDAPWAAYDLVSLGLHVKDLFAKQDLVEPDNSDLDLDDCLSDEEAAEVKKLSDKLRTMHEVLLPVLEFATVLLAAANTQKTRSGEKFRLKCRSINSMIRLFDNIIVSEYKSKEQLLWAGVLLVNIIVALHDWFGVDFTRGKGFTCECPICLDQKSDFIRLACHEQHIFCRDCLEAWTGPCPLCRTPRDPSNEVNVTEDELKALPV